MKETNRDRFFTLLLIILLGFFLRLLYLDKIPGEMWGDVNEHFDMAKNILKGNINLRFWAGDGPIFSYLIAFVSKFTGLSFFSIKLTTAIIGVVLIFINYMLAKEYFKNKKIGQIVAFLSAVSFWTLTFSRQGKPYILAALFTSLVLLFYLRKKYFLTGLTIGVGMYTQSSFWAMFLFSLLNWKMFFVASLVSSKLFYDFYSDKNILFSQNSYLGEKFIGSFHDGLINYVLGILRNYFVNLQALFYQGDRVFRHNIPFQPHLDIVTGVFLLIGLFFCFKRRHWLLFFTGFLCLLPTCLDVRNPLNNPAMGRTVSLTIIVFLIAGYGLYNCIKNKLLLILILIFIFLINFYHYFFLYPRTLPNANTPFGRIIAEDIENESKTAKKILVGCCWGDWGQPEPKSVLNSLTDNQEIMYFDQIDMKSICQELVNFKNNEIIIYTRPDNFDLVNQLSLCIDKRKINYLNLEKNQNKVSMKIVISQKD